MVNRILVCFSHRRFFHPFDHVWIEFPDCLQDWAEEQTGRRWIFTAAPCNHCLETHYDQEEKAQARPRILRPRALRASRAKSTRSDGPEGASVPPQPEALFVR